MIYLDHAATSPLDPRVLEAMLPYLKEEYGNPGSLHACGRSAKRAVDKARQQVAGFFNCEPEQVIFTSGGTEGNNTVIFGVETQLRRTGKNALIISRVEHDSVWKAAHRMCMKRDFDLAVCDPDGSGEITPDAVKDQFERSLDMQDWKPGLVSVMMANNETGVVNDTAAIAHFCHANGMLFHSDAVQAAGILPLDTKNVYPVDFMTVSSHKINGPKGMGALFARDPEILSPLIHGGADQEFGYRGGTENVAGIVGFGLACELASEEYAARLRYLTVQHSQFLFRVKSLAAQSGVPLRVNGDVGKILPKTVSLCFPGVDAETLLLMLDARGICLSAGSACRAHENTPSRVLTAMGVSPDDARCSVRVSLSHCNTPSELDAAAEAIVACAARLRGV